MQIQRVDVVKGRIVIKTLDVKGAKDIQFNKLVNAFTYLDKLFILGLFDMKKRLLEEESQYYLVIIEMSTLEVETTYPLGNSCIQYANMISSGLGKMHITIPRIISPCILKVDYT